MGSRKGSHHKHGPNDGGIPDGSPPYALVVHCGAYGRTVVLRVLDLAYKREFDARVKDMEKHMRCEDCGRKGWASIRVEWL